METNCGAAHVSSGCCAAGSLLEVRLTYAAFRSQRCCPAVTQEADEKRGRMKIERNRLKKVEDGRQSVVGFERIFTSRLSFRQILHPSVFLLLVAQRMTRTWRGWKNQSLSLSLLKPVPQSVHVASHRLQVTPICLRWVSVWWPILLRGYSCTGPLGVCPSPDSAHLQKHTNVFTYYKRGVQS